MSLEREAGLRSFMTEQGGEHATRDGVYRAGWNAAEAWLEQRLNLRDAVISEPSAAAVRSGATTGACELELARYLTGLPPKARNDARQAFRVAWHAASAAADQVNEATVRELVAELEHEQQRTAELEIELETLRQQIGAR
jgi:hypothetical protein